ncbi:MAG: polymerase sporulation-specific sigma factor [Thermotogaceae bacterium]|jgi:RNA polymerase sporulation-specific sigma factor|nr:polymerase sporulation-specific sigma factor [Thermotogaceae bacterium]MDN5337578.1 polymerase sporulation-specific sigma factor [Thermotogaceae bacterium]
MIKYRLRNKKIEEIIDLAQTGLQEAIEIIIDQYYPMVVKISSKYYGNWAEHEDIIQNGLVGLLKAIFYYQKNKSSFTSFAWRSIESEIKSFLTYLNRMKNKILTNAVNMDSIFLEDDSEEPGYMMTNSDVQDTNTPFDVYLAESFLEEAKKILTDLEYNVLKMRLEGYSYNDISETLEIKWKAVDNTYQKVKKKLRPLYERYKVIKSLVLVK